MRRAAMREVVAVQLGPEANGAGAHFWNFQDEAAGAAGAGGAAGEVAAGAPAPGALLRCSERGRGGGEVWAPRLVAVDLRGCRGSVRLSGDGGGGDDDGDDGSGGRGDGAGGATWDGPAATFAQPRLERNAFLRCLDEEEPGDGWGGSGEGEGHEDDDYSYDGEKEEGEDGEDFDWEGSDLYPEKDRAGEGAAAGAAAGALGAGGSGEDFQQRLEAAAGELEADAQHWTHYLKAVLGPRNVHELPGLWQGAAAFAGFGEGTEAARRGETLEAVLDNVRFFLEEADLCQGFQVSLDAGGGFAGVGGVVLEALRDDFGRLPLFVAELHAGDRGDAEAQQAQSGAPDGGALLQLYDLNRGLGLAAAARAADCLVPLWARAGARPEVHHWGWDPESPFRRGAALAVALDCLTLPYRVTERPRAGPYTPAGGAVDMNGFIETVRGAFRSPLAAAAVGLPFTAVGGEHPRPLETSFLSFTPGVAAAPKGAFSEFYTLRGLRRGRKTMGTAAALGAWEAEMREAMARGGAGPCVRGVCAVAQPLLAPLTFPTGMFSSRVGKHGDLAQERAVPGDAPPASAVHSCPAASKLHGSSKAWVSILQDGARRLRAAAAKGGGQRLLQSWDVEAGSVEEDLESIHDLINVYTRDGYLSSDSSDED